MAGMGGRKLAVLYEGWLTRYEGMLMFRSAKRRFGVLRGNTLSLFKTRAQAAVGDENAVVAVITLLRTIACHAVADSGELHHAFELMTADSKNMVFGTDSLREQSAWSGLMACLLACLLAHLA